jgi:hypothetical protein
VNREGRGLWIGLVLGAPLMAFAVVDAVSSSSRTQPGELVRWLLGLLLVVDLVVLPVALLAGRALRGRPWLRWAATNTAVVLAVSWPFVRGWGRSGGNPSLLPRDYGRGVAVAVVLVGAGAGVGAFMARARRRDRPRTG